jgi:hypothetical protein
MPRIRTLKPEFFTSEDIVNLSPLARLFFQACWCESDREGRMTWKPGTMKLRYFPADKCDIEKVASEVVQAGLVVIYSVEGKTYAHIPTFKRHQYVNPKESQSVIPAPTEENVTRSDASVTRADASNLDLTGVIFPTSIHITKGASENLETEFCEWWAAYPRRDGKADAEKAYAKARKRADHATLMAGAKRVAANPPENKKFIPMPATWLNGSRWLDEGTAPQSALGESGNAKPATYAEQVASEHRAHVRGFKERGHWSPNWDWPPDHPRCKVPKAILAEFGFGIGQKGEVA